MDYLFFDTECSDGSHLCEFGYVLTGEDGSVKEKDVILVNPEHRFCLRGKEPGDIKLHFKPAVYYRAKPFGAAYARISGLLTAPDRMIFGHSLVNDAKFLLARITTWLFRRFATATVRNFSATSTKKNAFLTSKRLARKWESRPKRFTSPTTTR